MSSGTSLTFLGFVDSKRASVHLLTVQLFDGLASTVVIHLDEAEATRAAGFTVENDSRSLHAAELRKKIFEFLVAS